MSEISFMEETNQLLKDILVACNNKNFYKQRINKIIDGLCDIERENLLKLYKHYLNIGLENKESIIKCRNMVRKSEVKGNELFITKIYTKK